MKISWSWSRLACHLAAANIGGCALLSAGCAGEESSSAPVEAPALPGASPEAQVLKKGDRGPAVEAVYRYLQKYGYFPNEELEDTYENWYPAIDESPADIEVFDDVLEEGLRRFQRTTGLPEDGTLNQATAELMAKSRCSFPDLYTGVPKKKAKVSGPAPFVYAGSKWGYTYLTYHHNNYTADLPVSVTRTAFRRSFDRWSAVSPLVFTEAAGTADIMIDFLSWTDPVYGAYGYFPPNGDIYFDEADTWYATGPLHDLESYAMHEIGHALGLEHSYYGTVMYAYDAYQRDLGLDDIQGIQAIYGKGPTHFVWSQAGAIPGKVCVQINEPSDPNAWSDNYLCSNTNLGIVWSYSGPVAGMRCTQMNEAAEPAAHGWSNNHICVPTASTLYFTWSSAGPIAGKMCTQIYESSDPHTWMDNHLCYQWM